jgi:hypothetical protein
VLRTRTRLRSGASQASAAPSFTLLIDFVGYSDPATGLSSSTLDMDFLGAPSTADQRFLELNFTDGLYTLGVPFTAAPQYTAYQQDASQPQSGITSIFVWS